MLSVGLTYMGLLICSAVASLLTSFCRTGTSAVMTLLEIGFIRPAIILEVVP